MSFKIEALAEEGIFFLNSPYSREELIKWNKLLDPYFSEHKDKVRYNIPLKDLSDLGILDDVLNNRSMRQVIRNISEYNVILMADIYEISEKQSKSHIP